MNNNSFSQELSDICSSLRNIVTDIAMLRLSLELL